MALKFLNKLKNFLRFNKYRFSLARSTLVNNSKIKKTQITKFFTASRGGVQKKLIY